MTRPFPISAATLQRRRILLAVALIDPITGDVVSEGMRVSVDKLASPPIVNRTGYFVWLAEGAARPTTVTIVPERLPFEPDTSTIPALPEPPPDDPAAPVAFKNERLLRIFLRPTGAYPFPDNAVVLRGNIRETPTPDAPPVQGARVVLEWCSEATDMSGSSVWIKSLAAGATDARGGFTAAFAMPPGARMHAPAGKDISLHLRFERAGGARIGGDIDLPAAPDDATIVRQGNNWILKNSLAWSDLNPA